MIPHAFLINGSMLAPTFYIFFASALPVIAFGEQLNRDTGKHLTLNSLKSFRPVLIFKVFLLNKQTWVVARVSVRK